MEPMPSTCSPVAKATRAGANDMALKVGAENKPKLYIAIGLGIVVLLLVVRTFSTYFGRSTPAAPAPARTTTGTSTPAPAPNSSANLAAYPHQATEIASSSALDPTLHPEVMEQAEHTTYTGTGRNIFSPDSVAPTPVAIPKVNHPIRPVPTGPPPPPPPPAIDLKFYGYSSANGGRREIFLLHGDDIFLAHEGDVVDRRYRVVSIRPFNVEIEDIPYHNTQSVPLTQN